MELFKNVPIIGSLNVDTNKFEPYVPSSMVPVPRVKLTPLSEKLLAAAHADGMSVAYGYIGVMGHFNPTVVCIGLTSTWEEAVLATETIKIVSDVTGVWNFSE